MKVLFSSNKNPHFSTFADYIEKGFKDNGHDTLFFENRDYVIPGRIRGRFSLFQDFDLKRINRNLIDVANSFKPDFFLEAGGWNILPETIITLKKAGIKTALWTIDAPWVFEPIIKASPHYDCVFTGGSEAFEILKDHRKESLYWLPFACDPEFHKPVELTDSEKQEFGFDICFVGSGWENFYPYRREYLEGLVDFNLGIWGPGWNDLPADSPLTKHIKGGQTDPVEWTRIYSASKIVFHSHYLDPAGKVPCFQVSPRVYEALACGAFLVVDNQKDLKRLFLSEKELVVFNDKNELREKVEYYLQHPDKAETIADAGRKKVLNNHTYSHRVKEIIAEAAKLY